MSADAEQIRAAVAELKAAAYDARLFEVMYMFMNAGDLAKYMEDPQAYYRSLHRDSTAGGAMAHYEQEHGVDLATEFEYLDAHFEKYITPLTGHVLMVSQLQEAAQVYRNPTMSGVDGSGLGELDKIFAGGKIDDWSGAFVDTLREDLIASIRNTVENQAHYADELAAAVQGHKALCEATHDAVLAIAQATTRSLVSFVERHKGSVEVPAMAILGAVITAAGMIAVPPAAGAALVFALIGLAHQTISIGIDIATSVEERTQQIQGALPDDIIASMGEAFTVLDRTISDEETGLASALDWDMSTLDGLRTKPEVFKNIEAYRPPIADGLPGEGDFQHNGA